MAATRSSRRRGSCLSAQLDLTKGNAKRSVDCGGAESELQETGEELPFPAGFNQAH